MGNDDRLTGTVGIGESHHMGIGRSGLRGGQDVKGDVAIDLDLVRLNQLLSVLCPAVLSNAGKVDDGGDIVGLDVFASLYRDFLSGTIRVDELDRVIDINGRELGVRSNRHVIQHSDFVVGLIAQFGSIRHCHTDTEAPKSLESVVAGDCGAAL